MTHVYYVLLIATNVKYSMHSNDESIGVIVQSTMTAPGFCHLITTYNNDSIISFVHHRNPILVSHIGVANQGVGARGAGAPKIFAFWI